MRRLTYLVFVITTANLFGQDSTTESREPALAPHGSERDKGIDRLWAEAESLAENEQLSDALEIGEQALSRMREKTSDDVSSLVEKLGWLAGVAEKVEQWEKSEMWRKEILDRTQKQHGDQDWRSTDALWALKQLQILRSLSDEQRQRLTDAEDLNLASVQLYQQGKFPDAMQKVEESEEVTRETLGEDHPDYADIIEKRAKLYYAMGDYAKAEPLYKQSREIVRKTLGKDHPRFAHNLNNLAVLYETRGDYAQAEPLYLQSSQILSKTLGESHPQYAQHIHNLAAFYARIGDYAQAEPLLKQSKEIVGKALGEDHRFNAICLHSLGLLYQQMGKYAQAESCYKECLEVWRKTVGEDHPDHAASLSNLADLLSTLGDYIQAEPLYRKSIDIRRKTLGENHPDYAQSLNNLGILHDKRGNYAEAERLYRQSNEITRDVFGENHPDYAASLSNLAALLVRLGDYAQAEPIFERYIEINRMAWGESHPDYASSIGKMAGIYLRAGDYARAEQLYKQSIEIKREALGEDHPDYASGLSKLATLYYSVGNFAQAEQLFRQSLEISRKSLGENHPRYAGQLNNLAVLYQDMADYARAEPLFQRSREITRITQGEDHPEHAASLHNLAGLYMRMTDYAQAEPLYKQGIEIWSKSLGEDHSDYATSLHNLAVLYESTGDYAQAELLHKKSNEIYRKVLGDDHHLYATSLLNLAGLYSTMGDDAQAEHLLNQSENIWHAALGEDHPDYAKILANLAWLYQRTDRYPDALLLHERSLGISRRHSDRTSLVLSERQQLRLANHYRRMLDGYVQCLRDGKLLSGANLEPLFLSKGQVLIRQRNMRRLNEDHSLKGRFALLQQKARQRSNLMTSRPLGWRKKAQTLLDELETLESQMMRSSENSQRLLKKPTLADIVKALPQNGVLVDYLQILLRDSEGKHSKGLVASIVTADDAPVLIDLGSADRAKENVDRWRRSYGESQESKAAGAALREQIWEPLMEYVDGQSVVLVSMDGALGRLPLAALPGEEQDSFLLEDHRIVMVPVPMLLPEMVAASESTPVTHEFLLVGAVDYELDAQAAPSSQPKKARPWGRRVASRGALRGDTTWPRLQETIKEIEFIRDIYTQLYQPESGAIVDLRRGQATETSFKELSQNCRLLHLATHGFFAPDKYESAMRRGQKNRHLGSINHQNRLEGYSPGLLSGLVFAGANNPPADPLSDADDGILTAEEIAFLRLDNVQLAVLSACETGLGEEAGGEGLLGLQRAFQVAGAKSVVASLWKVDDKTTRDLMIRFYRNLWERNLSPAEALRQAQLSILDGEEPSSDAKARGPGKIEKVRGSEPERTRRSPRYWAAWVFSGYPGN